MGGREGQLGFYAIADEVFKTKGEFSPKELGARANVSYMVVWYTLKRMQCVDHDRGKYNVVFNPLVDRGGSSACRGCHFTQGLNAYCPRFGEAIVKENQNGR